MTVEPIGYIVILLGVLASYYSSRMAVATLCLAMLLEQPQPFNSLHSAETAFNQVT
ncbi:hypothetical protein LP421_02350 (plasmid) [Rhizobium sp. RCAM05350]|nr:hypothetical protein LP421_02350 [Rhizobium sp. RCAM05350]